MAKVTVYCVQAFWRDGRKLARGNFRQFKDMDAAVRAGVAASTRNAGVVIFSIEGEPEVDHWGEPQVLATYGMVPRME